MEKKSEKMSLSNRLLHKLSYRLCLMLLCSIGMIHGPKREEGILIPDAKYVVKGEDIYSVTEGIGIRLPERINTGSEQVPIRIRLTDEQVDMMRDHPGKPFSELGRTASPKLPVSDRVQGITEDDVEPTYIPVKLSYQLCASKDGLWRVAREDDLDDWYAHRNKYGSDAAYNEGKARGWLHENEYGRVVFNDKFVVSKYKSERTLGTDFSEIFPEVLSLKRCEELVKEGKVTDDELGRFILPYIVRRYGINALDNNKIPWVDTLAFFPCAEEDITVGMRLWRTFIYNFKCFGYQNCRDESSARELGSRLYNKFGEYIYVKSFDMKDISDVVGHNEIGQYPLTNYLDTIFFVGRYAPPHTERLLSRVLFLSLSYYNDPRTQWTGWVKYTIPQRLLRHKSEILSLLRSSLESAEEYKEIERAVGEAPLMTVSLDRFPLMRISLPNPERHLLQYLSYPLYDKECILKTIKFLNELKKLSWSLFVEEGDSSDMDEFEKAESFITVLDKHYEFICSILDVPEETRKLDIFDTLASFRARSY